MSKEPAFLFYSSDFLTGTMFMDSDQVGKYIRLLCMQHQTGHLSEKHMLNICGEVDPDIYGKFVVDDEGKYYNVRLEEESVRRNSYVESRRKNRSGHEKTAETNNHMINHIESHIDLDMENENIDNNKGVKGEKKKVVETFESVISFYTSDPKLIEALHGWVEMRNKKKKGFTTRALRLAINKLDGLTGDKTELVDMATMKGWESFYQPQDSFGQQSQFAQQRGRSLLDDIKIK